jgi:hypothetical protein
LDDAAKELTELVELEQTGLRAGGTAPGAKADPEAKRLR